MRLYLKQDFEAADINGGHNMGDENNTNTQVKGTDELAQKMYENSVKTLKYQKLSALCLVGMLCVVLFGAVIVIPKAIYALDGIISIVDSANETIKKADATLSDISDMADSLEAAGDKMDKILEENEAVLVESMDKISKIDFEGLNEGIHDLQEAVGPFANFMSRFK